MRELVVPFADLLLGARCAGCGGAALLLCRACGSAIRPAPRTVWPGPEQVALRRPTPVVPVAAGANADVLKRVVVAWKEEGSTRLTDVLDLHLASAVVPHLTVGQRLALVPVPTSRRSRRKRGSDLLAELAQGAARRLRGIGADVSVAPVLAYARSTRDQAGLSAAERQLNLAGAFRLVREGALEGRETVVVDDILTTGATVAEAVRVLTEAHHRPLGASVVAATPRVPGSRSR
ncbi:ComF family protein [Aeromicrobium chenweiae]|uniref:Phosphoribosyltransferase n=1 Tax=Aeromicrobium chenweiae TaxID=2079793 RepID=A0A2S0WNT8_9ACTN|nr:phosphoribosyltransferase family protein [Aeromicrobium chenweiae]AWB93013.1 phosphoribosyltransferase [Aeromicrobium chenweiae]TGN34003.1 ComF family protein [Aeromicrobium chenweiae]